MNDRDAPRVALDYLGCKLNQAEIEALGRQLAEAGYTLVAPDAAADIYILNTCTVTHIADRKSRQRLRLARKRNPDARLAAIGCYAGRDPQTLASIDGVDIILGNDRKEDIVSILDDIYHPECPVSPTPPQPYESRRTRAFIKIQDGCQNFCAYCIVPLVRSRMLNVPADDVITQVKERAAAGYKEVVLTGTEIGTYKAGGVNLAGLLRRILSETSVARVRLSSLQPPEITPELLELWKDPRLCPHFHLSLQSGSDTLLRRMKRRYNVGEYERTVARIRQAVPDAAVTTDVIVGFPQETDAEFRETLDFCRRMQFARIHVFPYSPRPGTAAATMPGAVPDIIKDQRRRQMLALAEESATSFRQQYLGKSLEVLFEGKSGGMWTGLTGDYIRVYVKSAANLTNELVSVKLVELYRDGMRGEVIS